MSTLVRRLALALFGLVLATLAAEVLLRVLAPADRGVYAAKAGGRDRVVRFDTLELAAEPGLT